MVWENSTSGKNLVIFVIKSLKERSILSSKFLLKYCFADAMSARTVAFIFSVSAALFSQTIYAQTPAPAATQPAVNALPTGGKVVAGAATISQTQTATSATMNVNQTSQRAVVNWDSFNVGKNAQVNFNQPNQNAVILNRVTGGNASVINGAINANGQVVLVNPNGVAFGRGAQVDAASVVASTLDISNKEFMEGKSTFRGNGKGTIVNEGKITTNVEGGYIALLAPEVRNQGYLLAKKGGGTVAMAAGEQITLNFQNNYLISVKVDTGTYNALIENKRVVEVNGGLVVVAAGSAHQLMASVIKNTGRISASTAVNNGGVIELVANNVTQAGKVSANSQSAQGGQINIIGNDITIAQNSKTEATGATGGGQVNIGLASTQVTGGTQVNAQNPSAQSNTQAEATIKANAQAASSAKQMARAVTIEKDAVIDVSATKAGNGGTIAIWSEIKTTVAGVLKSTGGALSGNGGFIETSSKGTVALAPAVSVNTAANNKSGKSGTWLLDPIDLTIDSAAANVISAALSNNNVTIEVNANTTACPSLGGCTQNGSGSLTIASGADILKAGGNMTTLTLNSSGIFNLNANISGQNLNVIINSSIAYLNVGSSITASEVTVQAQTIYAAGNIQTSPYSLANNSNSLGNAIKLLAQAIYVSGGLSLNANLPSNSVQVVTVGGVAKRPDELPSYLTAQNNNQNSNLNQAYSATAANDANTIQALQANPASQSNVIYLTASNQLNINSTAQVLANGTTGGSIYAQAPVINTQAGSVMQANGNNGPGGVIAFSGDQITVAGNIAANGTTDGGSITLIANNGDLTMNSSTIQTNGSNGRGGSIALSATNNVTIQSSSIEATGLHQGGRILIGNDANNGTLPFALLTSIDQTSHINAAQLDPSDVNLNGGFIETSGDVLNLLATINAGRGGMWLLDPTNVTISSTASTGGSLSGAQSQASTSNFSTTDIQTAINAGTNVTILVSGTITQTTALTFNITTTGLTPTLTLNNTSGSKQAITLIAMTDNSSGVGSGVSLQAISAGGAIALNGAINLKGAITIDNTYGAASGTPASGYITASNVTTLATTSAAGIGVAGALTAKGLITLNGVATGAAAGNAGVIAGNTIAGAGGVTIMGIAGGTNGGVVLSASTVSITSSAGNISIDATTLGATNLGFNGATATAITATLGSVSVTGRAVGGSSVNQAGLITANSITISGTASGSPATNVSLGAMKINAGGGNITVTANSAAAGGDTGIYQVGAITDNAAGGSISFTSNNKINQTGAIGLVLNTSGTAANIIYDTTSGNKAGNITFGDVSIASGISSSAINFTAKSSGSSIAPGFIGTNTLPLPGSITLDNTFGLVSGTPTSGTISVAANNLGDATTSVGVNLSASSALNATGDITISGVSNAQIGVSYGSAIKSTAGSVTLNGSTTNYYAVYTNIASLITANNISINSASTTTTSGWLAQIGALTINAAATGGNITITAIGGVAGGGNGIYQSGAITGANGSDMSFITNNKIDINGVITVAANTSGTAANITFDTTRGTTASTISNTTFIVSSTGTSTSAINYIAKSAGSNINPGLIAANALVLPGYILLDNSYGRAVSSDSFTSGYINTTTGNLTTLASTSQGITIDNAIFASGNITLTGVSKGSFGINYSDAIKSSAADVTLSGSTTDYYGVYTSNDSLVTANNITITGRSGTAHTGWLVQAGALTINSGVNAGDIAISAISTDTGGRNGIYQSGAINAANGSNVTFTSNNKIDQNGTFVIAANTSGSAVNVTFDTTSGIKSSSISTGTLTISAAGTSTSDINFIAKAAGGSINPSLIGTSTLILPGYILLDNTFGCSGSGCTPATGFINTTTANLDTLAAVSATGITIDNAIYARGNISLYGVSNGAQGINYSVQIKSTAGDVLLSGSTTSNYGIFNSVESLIYGNNISLTGKSTLVVAGYLAQVGSFTINPASIGGDIAVTALGVAGGGNGIYQSGAINGASGSDINFTSNNRIDQNGTITLALNTSGAAGNITYDTSSGTKASSISTASLSFAAGTSTSAVNYSVLASGAPIVIGSAVTVPGLITLDNTYGCSGSGCAPYTGYLNRNLTSWETLVVTNNQGINIAGALNAAAITINGVNAGGGGAVMLRAVITATTGNINITGLGTSGFGVSNNYGGAWAATGIRANSGAVNITGTTTTSGDGVELGSTATISAKSITVIGSTDTGTYAVFLDAMTIVAGGTNLNVTGTVGATTNTGIYQAGTITDNAAGSNISFITNGKINQTGAISLVANTASTAVSVTYNTTSGSKTSSVVAGPLTIAAGTNDSAINYIIKTRGAAINPAAIGTLASPLPGYVLLDNSYGCSGTNCTPVTGFINATTNNLADLGTAVVGVTVNSTIFATSNISINGVTGASNQKAIDISVGLTSTNGSVTLNGATTTGYGVYSTTSVITANNISITGTASGSAVWVVQIESLKINSGSINGAIVVSGNVIGIPGAVGGIYQSGAITGANGTSISFISNNNISQNGAIGLVANTSGTAANISYDITYGLKTSTLVTGALTIPAGSSSSINYIIKTAGSAINPGTIGSATVSLPGYVLLDNTYGCTASTPACVPVTGYINTTTNNLADLSTASVGVTINGAIYARDNIIVNGVSTTSQAISYSTDITSNSGSVILNGGTVSGYGVYTAGSLITANNITITGTSSSAPAWAVQIYALKINSGSTGGSITVTGTVLGSPGATGGIYQIGAITGANGSNISFISNNDISQNGPIALVANTSGSDANITFDTSSGTSASTITTAALTIASTSSTSAINYIIKTAGSTINPGAIGSATVSLPGYVLLDNTYGCIASTPACTPVSGFINTSTNNLVALATAGNGVTINNAIFSSGDITVNGVNQSGNRAINISVNITSSNGSASFNGGTTTGYAFYATTSLITANNITILGTARDVPAWIVQLDALKVNVAGGDITVTANAINAPGAVGGIYLAGNVTGTNGSNISFISNNDIDLNGTIALVANTSGIAANIIVDTTTGDKTSSISTGPVTLTGTSTSAINYLVTTKGATISVPAISVPGYIYLDNTCSSCSAVVTPTNAAVNGAGISLRGALVSGTYGGTTGVTINAVANGSGVGFTQGAHNITSSAGGVTINVNGQTGTGYTSSGAILASNQVITINTSNTTAAGISTSGTINGGVINLISAQTTTSATLVPIYAVGLITANELNVTASGAASTTIVSLGAITINAGGGDITVVANNIAAGDKIGITQAGAITNNAVGSNISFTTNNKIDQGGAITLAANTGNEVANITFDTTSGDKTSSITTGTVAMAVGTSTVAINYIAKTNGAIISVPAIAVPGYILMDNTCLACNTAVTPANAFLNGVGLTLRGALSAGTLANPVGVTLNIVSNGTGIAVKQDANTITSAGGGVSISASSQTGTAYYSTGSITATGQAITIAATSTTAAGIDTTGAINGGIVNLSASQSTSTATAIPITATGLITAKSLTVTGTGGASSTIVSLGAIAINAGGGNITVTGNNAAAGDKIGIAQTGAITNNAIGSSISFISNNKITQGGAIGLVANTGTSSANLIYNTSAGSSISSITTGALTIASGSTAAINYLVKTNGATISVPAISVPGYILLDNTCLGCGTAATTSSAATNGAAITITGALSAGTLAGTTGVTVNAVANGSGIGFTQGANAISSSAGGVTITVNGQTGTGYSGSGSITATGQAVTINATTTSTGSGIYLTGAISGGAVSLTSTKTSATATLVHIAATGLITANSLTVNSSGGSSATLVSLGAITINAGGGNISVTANAADAGADTGIHQTGAITNNAAGSNISFVTNNKINQLGAIALVANTGAPAANILYDTTNGNKDSSISNGALTYTAGTGTVINFVAKSAGSAIATGAIGTSTAPLPGYVTLDNTYGCTTAPCTKTSGFITSDNASTLATASAGVTVANAIYSTGNIVINGASITAAGINYSAAINNTAGSIYLTGTSIGAAATSYGIYGSLAAGIISATDTSNGYVSLRGVSTLANLASDGIRTVTGATITGAAGVNLFADGFSGSITTGALVRNSGTTSGVVVNAYGNVSTTGLTNSGVDGIRIISGRGIAAGTTTGGTILALGTLSNTGGVIAVSMAKPENTACTTGCTIANAIGITTANANATTNIAYGITGGMPVQPGAYTSGNFINYRQKITSTVAITVTLDSNYSAVYGTAYNSNAANDWLQAHASVSYTGTSTAIFGLAATSDAYIKSVLIFSPTIGGTTASNGTNANAVQAATALTANSLSASDGSSVSLSGTARTYTITPAVLGINATGVYNGTTTLSNPTITTTGLASWDRITSVTISNANANSANAYVTAIGGTANYGYTFASSNYLINSGYNGTLSSGSPVNADQASATNKVVVTPAPLGVTISGVYSGTSTITPTAFAVTGLVNSQTITGLNSATVNNINVSANGSNYVTGISVSGGTASMDNYSLTAAYNTVAGNTQNTVTLTPKSLTITGITIGAKVYDGTTTATITAGSLDGVAVIDQSSASLSLTKTASFATANAANDVSVNVNRYHFYRHFLA